MKVAQTNGTIRVELESEADTEKLGQAIAHAAPLNTVIGLIGPLGAGKTRLSRAVAEALGVDPQTVASPTFVLIHEYNGSLPIYHFDTYRLGDADAFDALGPEDYWTSGGICLIEWADRVRDRLPPETWWIEIEQTSPTCRTASIHISDKQREIAILKNLENSQP